MAHRNRVHFSGKTIWPNRHQPVRSNSGGRVPPPRLLSAGPSRPPLSAPPSSSPETRNAPAPPVGTSGSEYTPEQEATDQINEKYGSAIAALLRQRERGKSELGSYTTATKKYGNDFDSKLKEIYDTLRQQLQGGQQNIATSYGQAQTAVGGAYDDTARAVGAAGTATQNEMDTTAEKLGLGAALTGSQSPLKDLLQAMQTQNTSNKNSSLAQLSASAAHSNRAAQGDIDAAAGEGATSRANLVKQLAGQLGHLNLTTLQNDNEITAKVAELETEKQSAYKQLVEQIKNARSEAEREASKEEFARMIQENTMRIQLAKLGLAEEKQSFDQGMSLQRLGLDQQKFGASLNNTGIDQQLKARGQDITVRGQDLAAQRALQKVKETEKKKKSGSLSVIEKRKRQAQIEKNMTKFASPKTKEAFYVIIDGNSEVRGALADLRETKDTLLKKDGISRKALERWIRAYYLYS